MSAATKRSDRIQIPMRQFLQIAARDGWTCHVCEVGYLANDPWEIDHDNPLSRGGTNHLSNLRLCHRSCNRDKGSLPSLNNAEGNNR